MEISTSVLLREHRHGNILHQPLDPDPRSRRVFSFHRLETLLAWVQHVAGGGSPLAQRLRELPPLPSLRLWPAQFETIINLEKSFAAGLPRALIQKATGAGKTFTAVNFTYRLVKYAGARRVLFLVDRGNLGRQTLKEFQQLVSPVNNYKFTEEYIVQHLSGNSLDKSGKIPEVGIIIGKGIGSICFHHFACRIGRRMTPIFYGFVIPVR